MVYEPATFLVRSVLRGTRPVESGTKSNAIFTLPGHESTSFVGRKSNAIFALPNHGSTSSVSHNSNAIFSLPDHGSTSSIGRKSNAIFALPGHGSMYSVGRKSNAIFALPCHGSTSSVSRESNAIFALPGHESTSSVDLYYTGFTFIIINPSHYPFVRNEQEWYLANASVTSTIENVFFLRGLYRLATGNQASEHNHPTHKIIPVRIIFLLCHKSLTQPYLQSISSIKPTCNGVSGPHGIEASPSTVDRHHQATHRRTRIDLCGRVDIFDMVDIDLFTVVALNTMVLKLGYTGESEPMFYNYLILLTSLDVGLYALACEEDVRCLATLVRSFKLIEVYIEHDVTILDSYLRKPRFRATLEDITDEPTGGIAENRTKKMLLTWHESSETTKEPYCILTSPTDGHVITYTQLSGVHRVDTQSHVLPTIQSQFSDINLSFVSQQASASHVIDDVMRQLSFDETELDGEAGFADVLGSGVDSSGLSHDKSFGVDDLDLNLNELRLALKSLLWQSVEDYVSFEEDAELGNGQEDESALIDGQFFYEDEGIDIAYETKYDVQSSEDAGTDDDDVDEDFLVDEENEIIEPDVDVHLFSISMDLPFDNIGITNLVPDDVLEGEDIDVINADGFDNDPGNDEERNYKKRSPKKAKDRVYLHSIKSKKNLKLYKNDSVRIRARCEGKVSVFTMSQGTGPIAYNGMEAGPSGSSDPTTRSKKERIQVVKTYKDTYTCLQSREIKHYTYKFLSEKIFEQVRVNPNIPVKAVQDQLQRELEYTNPNTTVKITVERNTDPYLPTRVFQRLYVCLGALKLGFRVCRIDLLGLDGAFMKGAFPGQVLVAVGLDSNNGIYPLAYALVEAETKSSWCWFLQCLGDDIDLHPNLNFTFINDRQKHEWCGQAYKDLLWRAASATNVRDFKTCILELKTMNPKVHEWLNKIPAEHWARSYFSGRAKSDLLLNNIYKVFNGKIVRGRDKLVITLLEYIREYCIKRIINVQGVIDKYTGPLTFTATRIMESIKKKAHLMKVQWNRANKYQVSGIPCKHAVAACWNMTLNDWVAPPSETWVNPCYWLSTWKETYCHKIQPICGTNYWEKFTCPTTLLPPKHHVQVGRPKKKRKRSKHEDEPFVKDGGNNAEGSGSASRQAQQTEPVVGQDGSGGSGAGAVIGLSATTGEGGAGDPGGAGVAS
nr:hypothetical protein [Tanacetum cinerariifolium]